jgi:hypothetical protein
MSLRLPRPHHFHFIFLLFLLFFFHLSPPVSPPAAPSTQHPAPIPSRVLTRTPTARALCCWQVFLGHLECPVINYWSSDEKLICTAAEMHNFSVGYSYMPVRVAMHSLSAASFAQGAFQYKYWDTSTPFIRRSSAGVLAGGDLQFGGLLRAATTDDITVTIGGFGCSLVNE